jgi:hypothetical protein
MPCRPRGRGSFRVLASAQVFSRLIYASERINLVVPFGMVCVVLSCQSGQFLSSESMQFFVWLLG